MPSLFGEEIKYSSKEAKFLGITRRKTNLKCATKQGHTESPLWTSRKMRGEIKGMNQETLRRICTVITRSIKSEIQYL